MVERSSLRVADVDRERVAGELREHMLAGRLNSEEFEERVDLAYKARTRADLEALGADLPISPETVRRELKARRRRARRRLAREAGASSGASLVCVAIWLASGAGAFWPAWVIGFTMFPVLFDGWALLGRAPDEARMEARIESRRRRQLARERRRALREQLLR